MITYGHAQEEDIPALDQVRVRDTLNAEVQAANEGGALYRMRQEALRMQATREEAQRLTINERYRLVSTTTNERPLQSTAMKLNCAIPPSLSNIRSAIPIHSDFASSRCFRTPTTGARDHKRREETRAVASWALAGGCECSES